MNRQSFALLAAIALSLIGLQAVAQTTPPVPPVAPAPAPSAVAATVNGQPVYEAAVQRCLTQRHVPPEKLVQARAAFLDFLIDNVLIDQYLEQLHIAVDPKEVETHLQTGRDEMNLKSKEDWDKWMHEMQITEAEVRQEATAFLRWQKYVNSVATDKLLHDFFDANKEMFDGTQVRARHILLVPPPNDAKKGEEAVAQLQLFKKDIERQVAEGLQQLPATTAPLEREKKRIELLVNAFSKIAEKNSACPSSKEGGDVKFFTRAGSFVEPFAKAAFSMKLFEMSDVVKTEYGYHLILVTDRVGTRDVKFDDAMKSAVLSVYGDKLREAMVTQARQKSKIEITPVAKP